MSKYDTQSKLIQKSLESAEDQISKLIHAGEEALTVNSELHDRGIKELIKHVDDRIALKTCDKIFKRAVS